MRLPASKCLRRRADQCQRRPEADPAEPAEIDAATAATLRERYDAVVVLAPKVGASRADFMLRTASRGADLVRCAAAEAYCFAG
jgi:hypothetical protein